MEGIDKWAEPVATSKPFESPDSHIKEKSQLKAYRGQHTSCILDTGKNIGT